MIMFVGYMVGTPELQMYIVLLMRGIIIIIKYKNSPFYKGALLWDTLPRQMKQFMSLIEFKKSLNNVYLRYDDKLI